MEKFVSKRNFEKNKFKKHNDDLVNKAQKLNFIIFTPILTNLNTLYLPVTSELILGSLLKVDQNQITFPLLP